MKETGVKETSEIIIAVNELALMLIKHFKDGITVSDFADIFAEITSSEEFKTKMFHAYEGVSKVSGEMKDIDVSEIVGLSSLQLSYIPKMLESFKKSE